MCDSPQVRPDDLHVDPLLLITDNHGPPQSTRRVSLFFTFSWKTFGRGHGCVIWSQSNKGNKRCWSTYLTEKTQW